MGILKTTLLVDVLHDSHLSLSGLGLERVAYEMDAGECLGSVTVLDSVRVDKAAVRREMLALGNDGEFFDLDEEDPLTQVEQGVNAEVQVDLAIQYLRRARDLLKSAKAPQACDKVRSSLRSAEGALRNAQCRTVRVRSPMPA